MSHKQERKRIHATFLSLSIPFLLRSPSPPAWEVMVLVLSTRNCILSRLHLIISILIQSLPFPTLFPLFFFGLYSVNNSSLHQSPPPHTSIAVVLALCMITVVVPLLMFFDYFF